jgi:hypothetical protein
LRPRTIIESEAFSSEKYFLCKDAEQLDDVLDGLTWALARGPELGWQVTPGIPLYAIGTLEWTIHSIESMTVYYLYDDETVTLVSIKPDSAPP